MLGNFWLPPWKNVYLPRWQFFTLIICSVFYRDDIVFKDPLNTFSGIENYKLIFWALRFHGKILFRALWVDIVSVWQPVENTIMVRWTVHGIPRVPWESRSRFDGTSEYKLDKDGKIYEHKVHNIAMNGPQKFQVPAVEHLIQSISCPSTPKPTYFEFSSSSLTKILPLTKLSVLKCYVASSLTKLLGSESESVSNGVHRGDSWFWSFGEHGLSHASWNRCFLGRWSLIAPGFSWRCFLMLYASRILEFVWHGS